MGEMWVFSMNGVSVRKVSTNFHNCAHKGHKILDEEKQFMASSGFTCPNVTIYDENMIPKKASAFGHKCTNCTYSNS